MVRRGNLYSTETEDHLVIELSVAVQRATALSAAGRAWPAASRASADAPAQKLDLNLADMLRRRTVRVRAGVGERLCERVAVA